MKIRLSEPRKKLLQYLSLAGGKLQGHRITLPDRRLASQMQGDGLVFWESPKGVFRTKNLDDWTLHLTEGGAEAIR